MNPPHTTRSRGYLPHWERPGGTYAVTFRLADSLPQSLLENYAFARQNILDTARQMNRELTDHERARLDKLFSEKIDAYLDQGQGECHLRHPSVGTLVFNALHHFHSQRYDLLAACVMPNHVHALFRPLDRFTLDDILHTWKSYTSNKANRILHRRGKFWMPEYYDHLIRDPSDLQNQKRYIQSNPSKARLKDWPWVT